MNSYCGNCGKHGHLYTQCKMPIISVGVVAFYRGSQGEYRFLMICRKHTLGYMDFMRGKYSIYNKEYIMGLLNVMTNHEKRSLVENNFKTLWKQLWCDTSAYYKPEETVSSKKFDELNRGIMTPAESYQLSGMVDEALRTNSWEEAEWGFPKGRRNYNESDMDCALREFTEETGYDNKRLKHIENIQQFDEVYMGSNQKLYKHKYYLMQLDISANDVIHRYDDSEVSKVEWKTYDEVIQCIRPYNLEKREFFKKVHKCLCKYRLLS